MHFELLSYQSSIPSNQTETSLLGWFHGGQNEEEETGKWCNYWAQENSSAWAGPKSYSDSLFQHGIVSAASLPHCITADTPTCTATIATSPFHAASASHRPSPCAFDTGFYAFRCTKYHILLPVNILWAFLLQIMSEYIFFPLVILNRTWIFPPTWLWFHITKANVRWMCCHLWTSSYRISPLRTTDAIRGDHFKQDVERIVLLWACNFPYSCW